MSNKALNIINQVKADQSVDRYRPLVRDLVRTSCTRPILLRNNPDMYTGRDYDVYIPCGDCENCRNRKANQLFSRLFIAAKELQNAYFITLTYASYDTPQEIPFQHLDAVWHYDNKNGNYRYCWRPCLIQYSHAQDYMKKLRVYLEREYGHDVDILYYIGAEYGSANGSPHFHIILLSRDKIPQSLMKKAWSIDHSTCGRMQIDDLFENGTMLGIDGRGAKKCFKYCAKYAGKGKPTDFNTARVKYAYEYFFKQIKTKNGYEAEFNYGHSIKPIQLQKAPQSRVEHLIDQFKVKQEQLTKAEAKRDKFRFAPHTRDQQRYPRWKALSDRYYKELIEIKKQIIKTQRISYVTDTNYAIDENSIRFGVPSKVLAFYNENRLYGWYRRAKKRGVSEPIPDETRLYAKSKQEFVPLTFGDFCSIYRQQGHISTGSVLKSIYASAYAERVADGNKRMPKGHICSLSDTATQANSKMALLYPDYFKLCEKKEKLPFVLRCKSLKQATVVHKITVKNHFETWMALYNAAIAYDGYLPTNHYVDLAWKHISKHGRPSLRELIAYTQLVGPYETNDIDTLSVKTSDGIFDQYDHAQNVLYTDCRDITSSTLYNALDGEYYRLVIGRTEYGMTDVKFAVYAYDTKWKCNVFQRYETFVDVYYAIADQFENYKVEWDEKRAYIDLNTQLYDTLKAGKEMTLDNLDAFEKQRKKIESRDYYEPSDIPCETIPVKAIYELSQEYNRQVEDNRLDWSRYIKDKETEHINKNTVC